MGSGQGKSDLIVFDSQMCDGIHNQNVRSNESVRLLYMTCLLKLTLCHGRTEFQMRLSPNGFRYTLPLQIR